MNKKTEYVEKLSAEMVEWDAQIDQLRFKADSASGEIKSGYREKIDALLKKRNEAALKLQAIPADDGDAWEELKAETDSVWDEVRTSLHDAILNIK